MWMSSSRSPCKKVVLISNYSRCKSSVATILTTNLIVVIFTTGVNISLQSTLCFCWKPLTTNRALYLLLPSCYSLTLNTYLLCNAFFPAGNMTKDQAWFFSSELISSFIAFFHCTDSLILNANTLVHHSLSVANSLLMESTLLEP
ncbi:hypothetical protein Tco_0701714 [Tanacetum coccineum]